MSVIELQAGIHAENINKQSVKASFKFFENENFQILAEGQKMILTNYVN